MLAKTVCCGMVFGMETTFNSIEERARDHLATLIANAIGLAVADKAEGLNTDVVLDAQGVADMLTTDPHEPVTERMVKQMATQQGLPGRKVAGRMGWRFTRNSVMEWIANGNA